MFGSLMMLVSGCRGQLAEFGQGVRDLLLIRQVVGELGEDAGGNRDVALDDVDAGRRSEGTNDGQKGTGGQKGCLIRERVNNL